MGIGRDEMASKQYRDSHLREIKMYRKSHREQNRLNKRERDKRYSMKNRDKKTAYMRRWRWEHPESRKVAHEYTVMYNAVHRMLIAGDVRKTSKSMKYIGCSPAFLRGWIEAQFQSGMTWENYGAVWDVDHIVPLKWWDLGNFPDHLMEASHYSNLQPLWKRDNIIKGARFAG